MSERFTIDDLTYEIDFAVDAITFAIVGGTNPVYDSAPCAPFDSPDD